MVPVTPSQLIIYQTDDGTTKLQVMFEEETVWLSQNQMAELFETTKQNVSLHVKNVFEEGELVRKSTVKDFLTVQTEGGVEKKRNIEHYNLDVVISVGYRVKSLRGTQFRIWATRLLKEYLVKGFTMDDERLKEGGARSRYFAELLERIRDIRSSERNFYQKVTDIYATSVDYKKDAELTKQFFATVQNKMHFAVHGYTAAEVIKQRVNSKLPFMGMTSFKNYYPTSRDITVAKNYLTEDELKRLNLVVSLFLDFAELQATRKRTMMMKDWIAKLDQFLVTSDHQLLKNAGTVSAEEAAEVAQEEFHKYKQKIDKGLVSDFDREVQKYLKSGNKNKP